MLDAGAIQGIDLSSLDQTPGKHVNPQINLEANFIAGGQKVKNLYNISSKSKNNTIITFIVASGLSVRSQEA